MLTERRTVEAKAEPNVAEVTLAREYRCAGCGYGAVLRSARPSCPMCGGTTWESPARGPALRSFAR
jgi:rubrerythrin